MEKLKIYFDSKAIIITTIIGLLNSFYFSNKSLMLLLCVIEVLWLFDNFIKGKYVDYVCLYLIFLAFSMESGNFVGEEGFYGFKNFRIAGLNVAVWMLLPILFSCIANYRLFYQRLGSLHRSILNKLTFFTISGMIMGVIVYLLDDYGFRSKAGSMTEMINSYYGYTIPFLTILSVSWCLVKEGVGLSKVKQYLFACLPATAIIFIVCLATENYGNRMGLASLQVSDIYFLLIASIILLSYKQFSLKEKVIIFITSIIIAILSLMYNASGKIIIILMLSPIVWLYILGKQGHKTQAFLYILIGLVVLMIVVPITGLPFISGDNIVFQTKMADVAGLLNWGSDNWLLSIPESPRMRITEFMNVGYEYILHPWYVFGGKGFCGNIQDHLGLFTFLDESAFSNWQLELGAYRGLHESFNTFFLVGGISGLYILFSSLKDILKNMDLSPWLMFGGLWLFLFYGYHMNVSIFGITSLVVGLIEVDKIRL
ncbi:hypothetical protein HMPREF1981_00020 [Bacteroides pyogenes F0041]|uniref:O-antigen polymerase n=1 Tax=Bacteroides pyogenes F0041 TaxID=1321819 RepID=U2CFP1_9BACE|nr:hypothetical protein [Bacteroides pyogenes]ERI89309.1 hypothetical protein HMPREF1981_00020 [Bacteroides pyogenes F0041]